MELTRRQLRTARKRRAFLKRSSTLGGSILVLALCFHGLSAGPAGAPPITDVDSTQTSAASQSVTVHTLPPVEDILRDSYTARSHEELIEEVRVAQAETRDFGPQAELLEKLATTELEPIHDPLSGAIGFPLHEYWTAAYEGNAFRTETRPDHKGSDYMLAEGSEILAVHDGIVSYASYNGNYGNVVYLITEINGVTVETRYAHMVDTPPVKVGQAMKRGDVLGHVGNTGKSRGNHLHFEVKQAGVYVDPSAWLLANAV